MYMQGSGTPIRVLSKVETLGVNALRINMSKLTDADSQTDVSHTIELFGCRLRRIESYLIGSDGIHSTLHPTTPSKGETIHAQLARLDEALVRLASQSQTVHDILSLRMKSRL